LKEGGGEDLLRVPTLLSGIVGLNPGQGNCACCVLWAGHITLTVPLSLGSGKFDAQGDPVGEE